MRRRGRAWPDSTGCGTPALPPLCLSEVELNVTKPRWGWATALSPCSPPTQQDEPFGERVNLQSSLSVALRRRQTLLEDSWLLEAERQCSFTIFPLQARLSLSTALLQRILAVACRVPSTMLTRIHDGNDQSIFHTYGVNV